MQAVVTPHTVPQMLVQRPLTSAANHSDSLQHGEIVLLQQKVGKVHEDVRRMASKIQGLKDETARELESFKKEMQKLKGDKGDYGAIVNALTGLRSQMKGNMTAVGEEFDNLKEEMKVYESSLENVGSLKERVDSKIEDVVKDIESLKQTVESCSNLSSTVNEMKTSIAAIQDMKYVSEFVNDFEQTLVGDIKGSSGDKKKAFTQQVEMLKKCVGVIDELKTTVKHKDMETVVNELRVIREDLSNAKEYKELKKNFAKLSKTVEEKLLKIEEA
ncbi:BdrC3, putative [Ixodes scapularis]|uniref:BdrC3, putative n=1 Tax=Ixodes scapularis TaxID=6945 RepID=B7QN03_IXOSC|nr:BdrC3, putative [Ixodes scapularis]|eukprot:XP_002400480.1 BdrC3, putative [Ixodes scapularis]